MIRRGPGESGVVLPLSIWNFMKGVGKFTGLVAAALLVALMGAAGCATTEPAAGKQVDSGKRVYLEKGMSAEDLIAAIGEPDEIRDAEPPAEGTEIWIYRKQGANVDMAVTGTKETPHFDPITGVYMPIIDPVYSAETSTVVEETQFLMVDGVMTAWKASRKEDRAYNR